MSQAQQIIDAINNFSSVKSVAQEIANAHPTLQQSFMRLCLEYIKIQSEKKSYDLRNQATVELCQKILKEIPYEDQYVPMI